jgi:N-acylneuraminate cytidylyltransferase
MKNIIAIIPARGGSKRIPRQNLVAVAGLPLVAHSILQAKNTKQVKRVFVSTEDPEIAKVAKQYGAEVVERPLELANDKATSESAQLHVLDYLKKQGEQEPDLVVFLQPTSPFRKADDIDKAIETLITSKADSLFSACRDHGLFWRLKNGQIESSNYDYQNRLREQDMGIQYRENGSIYVYKPAILRQYNNRLGGKIAVYEMSLFCSFQIDRPEDIKLIELLQPLI